MLRPRSMTGYLLLPRPGDTAKLLLLPAGFAIGVLTRGAPDTDGLLRALLVWACLELLVYQARYQWNDIRGFDADQQHPDGDRGRLPGPQSKRRSRIGTSGVVAVAKVLLAVVACAAVDRSLGVAMGLLAVGVFALAAVYELLRTRCTGRTAEVPAPITRGVLAIWFVIGAGYALRTVTGLALAVELTRPPALPALAIAAAWAFGCAWITSRWALEATAFAERRTDGTLGWHAHADQAKEHQLALVRWLPTPEVGTDPRTWRAVQRRTPWVAPWNVVGCLAGALAASTGFVLVEPRAGVVDLLLLAGVGGAASALALGAGRFRPAATVFGAVLVLAAAGMAGTDSPLRAIVAWSFLSLAQLCYLAQDRATLGRFVRAAVRRRRAAGPSRRASRGSARRGRRAPSHLRTDDRESLPWTPPS